MNTYIKPLNTNKKNSWLIILLLLVCAVSASAQSTGVTVIVETSSETPASGSPWTLTFLVNYPEPNDVNILSSSLPSILTLDRLVKIPRMKDDKIWTSVEYRFIPEGYGQITLPPFTVVCPPGTTQTDPLTLFISGTDTEMRPVKPRVTWENVPSWVIQGKRTVFALRVTGWTAPQPGPEFFMPEVPQGAILELAQLSTKERADGIAMKLAFVPLDAGDFRLPARTLQYENFIFESPALHIRVFESLEKSSRRDVASQGDAETRREKEVTDISSEKTAFPEFEKYTFVKTNQDQIKNIYNTAKDFWSSGQYAQSLAELRRNERDHPAGALLQPLRREAEEKLGFLNTENESRLWRKLLLGLSIFLFSHVIFFLFVCFKKIKSVFWKKTVYICAVVFAVIGIFCLIRLLNTSEKQSKKNSRSSHFGVTLETSGRRAADDAGEELFIFREGQPVIILQNSREWVFVRTNDATGTTGWIPAIKVIIY